jgi:phage terminase Nu1 subunit (DNA packaging protein)
MQSPERRSICAWRARGCPLVFDGNAVPKVAFDAVIRLATAQQPKSR